MRFSINIFCFLSFISIFFSACLYTHKQVKKIEKSEKIEGHIHSVQKQVANQDAQFNEINESLRHMNGQFEVLQKEIKDLKEQNKVLQQNIEVMDKKNEKNFRLFEQEMELLRSNRSKGRRKKSYSKKKKKDRIVFTKS